MNTYILKYMKKSTNKSVAEMAQLVEQFIRNE